MTVLVRTSISLTDWPTKLIFSQLPANKDASMELEQSSLLEAVTKQ
jgi:hypothetical protein